MNIYPKYYCDRITDIKVDFLKENNIKGLILDVDNTLLDTRLNMVEGLEEWHDEIVKAGICATDAYGYVHEKYIEAHISDTDKNDFFKNNTDGDGNQCQQQQTFQQQYRHISTPPFFLLQCPGRLPPGSAYMQLCR